MLPAPESLVEFASLIIGPVDDALFGKTGAVDWLEIVMGAVVIQLDAGASAERIVSVVRGLRPCSIDQSRRAAVDR